MALSLSIRAGKRHFTVNSVPENGAFDLEEAATLFNERMTAQQDMIIDQALPSSSDEITEPNRVHPSMRTARSSDELPPENKPATPPPVRTHRQPPFREPLFTNDAHHAQIEMMRLLSSSLAMKLQLTPNGCMNRYFLETYRRAPRFKDPSNTERFTDRKDKAYMEDAKTRFFKFVNQVDDHDSRTIFKEGKSMHYFELALWGLMENSRYHLFDSMHIDPEDDSFHFKSNVGRDWAYRPNYQTSSTEVEKWFYSIYILGELAIPLNVADIRTKLRDLAAQVYGAECSVFSPLLLFALGQRLLETVSTYTRSSLGKTWGVVGNQWNRARDVEQYLKMSKSLEKQLVTALEGRTGTEMDFEKLSMAEMSAFPSSPNSSDKSSSSQAADEVGPDGEYNGRDKFVRWDVLGNILYMIHHDRDMQLSSVMENMFNSITINYRDSGSFHHIFVPTLNNPDRVRFWRQLKSIALVLMEAGQKEYQRILSKYPRAQALRDTCPAWKTTLKFLKTKGMVDYEDLYSNIPGLFSSSHSAAWRYL